VTTGRFDTDTAIERGDDLRFAAEVTDGWDIGAIPNGGYLLAIAGRALCAALDRPDPVALSAHYLSPATHGRADLDVEVLREGRGLATGLVRMHQEGSLRLVVTGTCGDLSTSDGPTILRAEPPDLPPPEACVPALPSPRFPRILERFDMRLVPESAAFAVGIRHGNAEMAGWLRFSDDRDFDAAALPLVSDAMPPAVFLMMETGWVPTVELTVHVRARPVPGWLRCRFVTRFVTDGWLEEDGEVWDEHGTLVCLSRQLARVREGSPTYGSG
jgi:acyl-CoA thioesterase